jgi:MraZ protein
MLLGTYREVQLGPEGLVLPSQVRDDLRGGLVLARGLDRCVAIFPLAVWDGLLERVEDGASFLREAARLFQRHLYGGASVETLGPDGLLTVPEHLRTYAGLEDQVVLVGVGSRLEIWNPQRWSQEEWRMGERASQVSEELSGLGI